MTTQSDTRYAIAAALAQTDTEGTADESAETTGDVTDAASSQAAQDKDVDTGAEEAATEPAASEAVAEPNLYYGVDLSGLPADEASAIKAGFEERDKFIQQLLRDKASGETEVEAQDESTSDEDVVTDDAILEALGLNSDGDVFAEHTAKVALPLAKMVLELREQVTGLSERAEIESTDRYWSTSLTALEKQYGPLPVSQDEVIKLAAEASIAEPMDAYWRIMGPGRQQVFTEVQKRRAELEKSLKKGASGQTRPSDQADTTEKIIEAKDVKDAMRQAFAALQKERGYALNED